MTIKEGIYAALAALWLFSVAGMAVWQHHEGALAQASKDQARFDQINADLVKQKHDANAILSRAASDALALAEERDELKTKLETEHAQNETTTRALQSKYAGLRLKFQSSGCGPSGSGSVPQAPGAAILAAPAQCVVPDKIAADMGQLAADADTLADNYRLCYSYVTSVK